MGTVKTVQLSTMLMASLTLAGWLLVAAGRRLSMATQPPRSTSPVLHGRQVGDKAEVEKACGWNKVHLLATDVNTGIHATFVFVNSEPDAEALNEGFYGPEDEHHHHDGRLVAANPRYLHMCRANLTWLNLFSRSSEVIKSPGRDNPSRLSG
jgi:hypothetical protein